jgi:hypothetical protein
MIGVAEWSHLVDDARRSGEHPALVRGRWTGYLPSGTADGYVLRRIRSPEVYVVHNDPDRCIELAEIIEHAFEKEGIHE